MYIVLRPKGALLLLLVAGMLCCTAFLRLPDLPALWAKSPTPVSAAAPAPVPNRPAYPVRGLIALDDDPSQWAVVYDGNNRSSLSITDKPTIYSKRGEMIGIFPARVSGDKARLQRVLTQTMYMGSHVVLSFAARCTNRAQLRAILFAGGNSETPLPESKADTDLFDAVDLTPDWQVYTVSFSCTRTYRANLARLQFQPDRSAGTIELAAVTLTDFGPDSASPVSGSKMP